MEIDSEMAHAIANAVGNADFDREFASRALDLHNNASTEALKHMLDERLREFEATGHRGAELADEIDSLRIALAARDFLELNPGDHAEALFVQSACNLSGVVFAFAKVMKKICWEAQQRGYGTEWRNRHPISILYCEQIHHLACGAHECLESDYSKAYAACETEALKTLKPGEKPSWRTS